MDIGGINIEQINGLQDIVNVSLLKRSTDQSKFNADKLIEGMENVSAKTMESSVNPHLGGNVDVNL